MLTGKALARVIRGHFLVDAALTALLVCNTFDNPLSDLTEGTEPTLDGNEPQSNMNADLMVAKELYENATKNPATGIDEVCGSEGLTRLLQGVK